MILRKKVHCKSTKNEWKILSQQNRVNKICSETGFLTTVGVGQNFMTKDTEEFSQFTDAVACSEHILPRDENSSETKGWIRGNTKIGPVLEVTTSYLQGKYRVEIRIEFVNHDNSHSWVRISHGLNKLVTDLSNKDDDNEQETSEIQFEDFSLKTNVLAYASRSKAKARPRRLTSACSSARSAFYLWKILDWCWAMILFAHRLPSNKKTKHSSLTRIITSTRRLSDRILETERWSSE